MKAGFYWDAQENLQSNGSDINGNYDFENWGCSSTYNIELDRLMGRGHCTTTSTTLTWFRISLWHQWSIWAQDSWKATRKLTLNLGLRADHEGQWYDKIGWNPGLGSGHLRQYAEPTANTGLLWHEHRFEDSELGLEKPAVLL